MSYVEELGIRSKRAASVLNILGQEKKKEALKAAAVLLKENSGYLLEQNKLDLELAEKNGMKDALLDRLRLTADRIESMALGLVQVASLEDPIGEVITMKKRPNGLLIGQKRVPLGVVGIIYESRPNVTADAFGLCFKTGNAVILKGGSDAIHSNIAIVKVLQKALEESGIPGDAVQLVEDTRREIVLEIMRLNRYIDVLIPRGGAGLIRTVVENSTVPVIETGTGNCHIYVDEYADISMAEDIIDNAKTQRLGVCNACESLVIHEKAAKEAIPRIYERLKGIEVRGDEKAREICGEIIKAEEEDWGCEYLDAIISLKVVASIEEAISHINRYSTKHSDAIITKDYAHGMKFMEEIDSAAVYINASTRFTDGFEFGFGAEIGISTQKLHARGPMGLLALTTIKYIIFGEGQIRP